MSDGFAVHEMGFKAYEMGLVAHEMGLLAGEMELLAHELGKWLAGWVYWLRKEIHGAHYMSIERKCLTCEVCAALKFNQ